jgi:AcrR family transcriptional regulator
MGITVSPMPESQRARMKTDERREQLLNAGVGLLAGRPHQDISIEEVAEAAEVSKGLLYHYFPTKKDFILAAVARGQAELSERLQPDPSLPPEEQLNTTLDAFLDYVEEHATVYMAIFTIGGEDPDIAEAMEAGRGETLKTLLKGLEGWEGSPVSTDPSPALETAAQGWMFFVEGAVLRWLKHRDLERQSIRIMLAAALMGSLFAARAAGAPAPPGSPAED